MTQLTPVFEASAMMGTQENTKLPLFLRLMLLIPILLEWEHRGIILLEWEHRRMLIPPFLGQMRLTLILLEWEHRRMKIPPIRGDFLSRFSVHFSFRVHAIL